MEELLGVEEVARVVQALDHAEYGDRVGLERGGVGLEEGGVGLEGG